MVVIVVLITNADSQQMMGIMLMVVRKMGKLLVVKAVLCRAAGGGSGDEDGECNGCYDDNDTVGMTLQTAQCDITMSICVHLVFKDKKNHLIGTRARVPGLRSGHVKRKPKLSIFFFFLTGIT